MMSKVSKDNISKFFSRPDVWLASINLGNDSVFGKIKDKQALLEGIPEPSTGFRFNDIVEISEPIGTTYFRDEQIPVYKAKSIIHSSNKPTFSFEGIIPTSPDWFDLSEIFKRHNSNMRFPYQNNYPVKHWEKGYCTANNIKEVESIFEEFIVSGKDRKIKNITDSFDDSNIIAREIDGKKFILELKYPTKFINTILILLSLPIILFFIVAIKVGLHSVSDVIGFVVTILIIIGLEIYSNLRLKRETIILDINGVIAKYPIRKQKILNWENISEVKFSKSKDYIDIGNNNGLKIRISQHHQSFRRFCIIAKNFIGSETNKKIFDTVIKRGTA